MSFRQIFDRMNRIARSYSSDGWGSEREELRRAEEIIEQERQREERERAAKFGSPASGGPAKDGAGDAPEADAPGEEIPPQGADRVRYQEAVAVLALSEGASWEEISVAYRRLVGIHHPDRASHLSPEEQRNAARKTQELNVAYAYLRNVHGRK